MAASCSAAHLVASRTPDLVRAPCAPQWRASHRAGQPALLSPLPAPAAADEAASAVSAMDAAAIELDQHGVKPVRGADGRLQPVLTLPGDTLATTPSMVGLTGTCSALALAVVARAFLVSLAAGSLPIYPLLGVGAGLVAGELFSGAFHWATDNC